MGALSSFLGKNKDRKQQQQQWDAEMKFRRDQQNAELAQRDKEFDWRKQGEAWDMRQKDIEYGFKRDNANANMPMARQIMATLHKLGGYAPLEMMDKYAKGEAYFPASGGSGVPVPGATPPPPPPPPAQDIAMRRPRPNAMMGNAFQLRRGGFA